MFLRMRVFRKLATEFRRVHPTNVFQAAIIPRLRELLRIVKDFSDFALKSRNVAMSGRENLSFHVFGNFPNHDSKTKAQSGVILNRTAKLFKVCVCDCAAGHRIPEQKHPLLPFSIGGCVVSF